MPKRWDLSSSKIPSALFIVGLGMLIMFTFAPVLHHFFLADDAIWILHGQDIRNIMSPHPGSGYLRPGTTFFYYLIDLFFGVSPAVYHLMSILLHFLNVSVFFFLSYRLHLLFNRGNPAQSHLFAVGSSLIAAVPFCAFAAIVWLSSIHDLLTTLFYLLSVFFLLKSIQEGAIYRYLFYCYIAYIMALLFKEQALTLPVLILPLLLFCPAPRRFKIITFSGFIIFSCLYAGFYFIFAPPRANPFAEHYKFQFDGFLTFLDLSIEMIVSLFGVIRHPRIMESTAYPAFQALQIAALVTFLSACVVVVKNRAMPDVKILFTGIFFMTINLLPLSFFAFLKIPLAAFGARYHYFYLPFFGLSLVVSGLFSSLFPVSRKMMLLLVVFLFFSTVTRVVATSVAVEKYGRLSRLNQTIIRKVIHSPVIAKYDTVTLINPMNDPTYHIFQFFLSDYLRLFLHRNFHVRYVQTRSQLSSLKEGIFIVVVPGGIDEKTQEFNEFLSKQKTGKR